MEKERPLDGRKYNKNNKDIQMGQVKPKKKGLLYGTTLEQMFSGKIFSFL